MTGMIAQDGVSLLLAADRVPMLIDCTESYFPQFKAQTVEMIHAQGGIVGWTAPSPLLLEALTRL